MVTPPGPPSLLLETLARSLASPPRSQRRPRYSGDDRAVALSELSSSDRDGVRQLYELLTSFDAILRETPARADEPDRAKRLAVGFDLDCALAVARSLGARRDLSDEVRHALHDVRGGALTSLLLEVQRSRLSPAGDGARALRTLAADHLKVMRSALLELDDAHRAADLLPREHSAGRLAETLARVTGSGTRGPVDVVVDCSFTGGVTMSCIELGALDRAVLNVLNNAVRHSAGAKVAVLLAPAGSGPGSDLRVCVANHLEETQKRASSRAFRRRADADLRRALHHHGLRRRTEDMPRACDVRVRPGARRRRRSSHTRRCDDRGRVVRRVALLAGGSLSRGHAAHRPYRVDRVAWSVAHVTYASVVVKDDAELHRRRWPRGAHHAPSLALLLEGRDRQ